MSGTMVIEDEDEFVVEDICGERTHEGVQQFLVKWRGYIDSDTWEPEENLANCADMLQAFKSAAEKQLEPVVPKKRTAKTPAAPRMLCSRQCSECSVHVQLSQASRADASGTRTYRFRCADCRAKARTVHCSVCKKSIQLQRLSGATTGTRKFTCVDCRAKVAKGVANGTCGNLVALQFSSTPNVVRHALQQSGRYDGDVDDADGFISLDPAAIEKVVIRVSGAKWHGVDLPENVAPVLPILTSPRRSKISTKGCVALPLLHKSPKKATLSGTRAALSSVSKIMKRPCSYELAFALTDFKLQGMTLEQLVVIIGTYPYPLR
eukprot:COSAG01_NODE_18181_length_1095_cov_0.891566_2_plen_320_part_01